MRAVVLASCAAAAISAGALLPTTALAQDFGNDDPNHALRMEAESAQMNRGDGGESANQFRGGRGRGDRGDERGDDRRDWRDNDRHDRRDLRDHNGGWDRHHRHGPTVYIAPGWNSWDAGRRWNRFNDPWGYDYSWRWNRPSYNSNHVNAWDIVALGLFSAIVIEALSDNSRRHHESAYSQAMRAPVGESIVWNEANAAGTVRTTRDGYAGDKYCREFQQTITVNGQRQDAWGVTCQEPDGSWKIVPQN
ncbi:MAG: hypothetical protein EXR11_02145 [Rhodospirillaceae bacterium]|nr:hypothetical protein [Rhodospirillaceae bacterium]